MDIRISVCDCARHRERFGTSFDTFWLRLDRNLATSCYSYDHKCWVQGATCQDKNDADFQKAEVGGPGTKFGSRHVYTLRMWLDVMKLYDIYIYVYINDSIIEIVIRMVSGQEHYQYIFLLTDRIEEFAHLHLPIASYSNNRPDGLQCIWCKMLIKSFKHSEVKLGGLNLMWQILLSLTKTQPGLAPRRAPIHVLFRPWLRAHKLSKPTDHCQISKGSWNTGSPYYCSYWMCFCNKRRNLTRKGRCIVCADAEIDSYS